MANPDPEASLGFVVGDMARLLRHNFNRRAHTLGLSLAQARALAFLSREEGVKQVELADRLEIHPMTLARLIDGLQGMGLVTRRPDMADRRAFRLHLTAEGNALIDRMWGLAAETRREAVAGIPAEAVEQVVTTLLRMKENLLRAEAGNGGGTDRPRRGDRG